MRIPLMISLVCATAVTAASAHAQQAPLEGSSPHGMVALGAGIVPEYDGAGEVRPFPLAIADIRWQGLNFQLRGGGARVDVISDRRLAAGPLIGPRLARRDVDGRVGRLPEIDLAIEAGGFVGYRFGGDELGQGSVQLELSVIQDISSTHNGLLATLGASYAAVQNADMFVSLDMRTTWADEDYSNTYFGIDQAGSAASGLERYSPGPGIRDVGASLTAGHWFSRRFGLIGHVGASYLVGEIADSPITDEGSRWQPAAGLLLAYRF